MIGKDKLMKALQAGLKTSRADQTEIVFVGEESGLTRYANSTVHQNVYENNSRIIVRAVVGKRVGVASTNSLTPAALAQTVRDAAEIALTQPEIPYFPGLPKPATYKRLNTFDSATARQTPMQRAKVAKAVICEATKRGFTMAGAFSTSSSEIAVVNSLGVRAYQPLSAAAVNMIAMSDTSSGYASGYARRVSDIDFKTLAKRAVEKCDLSQHPIEMDPGDYEVILEPAAVIEVLEWLNYVSFGSKPFEQGTSFLAGRIGRKLTSEKISIYDDPFDTRLLPMPFDFEGVPKKRIPILVKGVARGVVYDRLAAARSKTRSTGNALPATDSAQGAYSLNLTLQPGKTPLAKMIAGVKRGILVTRFHYINGLVDTRNSVLTGMTRDGTFLIENGAIAHGIKNLRFTDSIMRAFKTTKAISKETVSGGAWWSAIGSITAPALHLGSFRFSGKTDF